MHSHVNSKHRQTMAEIEAQKEEIALDREIYGPKELQILDRGLTLPDTGAANINKKQLLRSFARSNCEMAYNIEKGTYPVFGYPLVCFSPVQMGGEITNW